MDEDLFRIESPLGFPIRVPRAQWIRIVSTKHPSMQGYVDDVRLALAEPHQIRRSKKVPDVYLCYREIAKRRWVCAVIRYLDMDAFLVTAYLTDAIQEGEA